jgi:hypothetical protein
MNMRHTLATLMISLATLTVGAGGFSLIATTSGCDTDDGGKKCELVANLSRAACTQGTFTTPTSIDNPFFPLSPGGKRGAKWVLEGVEEGEKIRLEIDVTATDVKVGNVTTVVMTETEYENGELVEISYNYFAEADDGTVCYFGEAVDDYKDGVIVSHEGEWRADEPGNEPGIIMPANPQLGNVYEQEYAPGLAQDISEIVATGEQWIVPRGTYTDTLTTHECTPLEKGSDEPKAYARNVGLIYDNGVELLSYTAAP